MAGLELLHGRMSPAVAVLHPAESAVQQVGKKPCLTMHASS